MIDEKGQPWTDVRQHTPDPRNRQHFIDASARGPAKLPRRQTSTGHKAKGSEWSTGSDLHRPLLRAPGATAFSVTATSGTSNDTTSGSDDRSGQDFRPDPSPGS